MDCRLLSPKPFPFPESKVHGTNMGPIWVLSAPDGPHVGPMNFAIWVIIQCWQSVSFTHGSVLHWDLNQNTELSIEKCVRKCLPKCWPFYSSLTHQSFVASMIPYQLQTPGIPREISSLSGQCTHELCLFERYDICIPLSSIRNRHLWF